MTDLTVCCWLWFDTARQRNYQFGPDDVRVWDRMVARNLTIPHRRVCITHRPDLVEDFIETVPLDLATHVPGTCLVKLMAHRPGVENVLGPRILSMDIDCVVVGSLDPLVQREEPSVWWRNPNFTVGGRRGFIQGSMQLFTPGATSFLWSDFDARASCGRVQGQPRIEVPLNRRFGGAEQCWISERLNTAYPDAGWEWDVPHWTEADGVYGAGRLMNGKMGNGVQSELPENARIVFTPGDRSPSQPEFQAKHLWVREYWR